MMLWSWLGCPSSSCSSAVLAGGPKGLTVALAMLPTLECLSISNVRECDGRTSSISVAVLSKLQQLTYLRLKRIQLLRPGPGAPFLQPLKALTGLAELCIAIALEKTSGASARDSYTLDAGMMPDTHHLTCLVLRADVILGPGVLEDNTQLQHLSLELGSLLGGPARVAQLLSELQHLQQLTDIDLQGSLRVTTDNPPVAAFSALTASSNLQHLNISKCTLPAGIWQHMFPSAGRQLPRLQSLDISGIWLPSGGFVAAPDGSCLVSCCPGLQSLGMQFLQGSVKQLGPLQELSRLRTLSLTLTAYQRKKQVLELLGSLTGLRHLCLCALGVSDRLVLLQLTELKHLTGLSYEGRLSGALTRLELSSQNPDEEPVWRQVLRNHLDHQNLEVAQQAAAALLELPLLQEPSATRAESAVG